MLKKITLTALLIALPLSATMIYAEDVEPPSSIESAQNIVVDDEYDATTEIIEEVEVIEEQTTEQVEEEVVVEEVIEEVEEPQEQEQEVVEENLTEEVKEEETTEEDKLELQPAPMMTMAAPRMLGASRAATNDPTDPENFDILNNYGPVYVTITWTEFIHAKFATNISYNFTGNGWEQVVSDFTTVSQAYGSYKLKNKSLNNIYVHMNYTPVVEGTSLKLFQDASFNTDGSLNTNLQNWTVEKCEYRKYDIDGDGLGTRGGDYSSRYISYMKEADIDNQYWCAALSGYGRQKGPAGGNRTQVVPDGMVKYYTSIWNKDYIEVDARDKVCSYMGWWCVRWLSSDGTKSTINTDQLSENGGVLGTVTFRIDEVLENYDQFFTK